MHTHKIAMQALCSEVPVHLQVEGRELQVLYPLLEFLHHHRLNAADPHGLSDMFAPLLMRPQCDVELRDAEHIMEAYGLLTDLLIQRYRTLFSGERCLPS